MDIRNSDCAFKLPIAFDAYRLAQDANKLEQLQRLPQPGPHHKGEWTGIALHSAGGVQSTAPSFPSLAPYALTPEADQVPYLKEIINSLTFPLQVVRVLRLPPGGVIGNHIDFDTNFQFGLIRLHIPIQTNPQVEFLICGRRYEMQVGELWYGDFSLPHQVFNNGNVARLHLVIDVEINRYLLSLMPVEYLAEQSKLGPISLNRDEWPESMDLQSFQCRFFIPGTVLPLLVLGSLMELIAGASAEVERQDGVLVLLLNRKPHCRLIRVDEEEFVLLGMPPGCLLQLRRENGRVCKVGLVVRGVQEDLVSARVGVARGLRIPERFIDLKLQ